MNICFISNFKKTYVYLEVAQRLENQYGHKVFWIIVNSKYHRILKGLYPAERLLYIHKALPFSDDCVGEYKLNEIVCYDRFLSIDIPAGVKFLKTIQRPVYRFLQENDIRFVFGEVTWSHEILISRIIADHQELRCAYYKPNVVRLPNNRFAYFPPEHEILAPVPGINYESMDYPLVELQRQEYTKAIEQKIKESYNIKVKLARAKRFFTKENIEKEDPSLPYKFRQRLLKGTRQELFRSMYKLLKTITLEELEGKKFVVYPLHVQPESSIDVIGRYYNDQYLNIKNVWKILPNNWKLVVKEHTNGIGDRSMNFYKRIKSLPGVEVINERTNSHALIAASQAVFTVSGTVAYEAALMQKTSFTFADMFFNLLPYCHKLTLEDLDWCKNLEDLIEKKNALNDQKMPLKVFSNMVYHHSYEGLWELVDPRTMTRENLNKLADATNDFIKRTST